jgi:ubiquinone/menaquinone biosynthesis C-methylase UbiE
VVPNRKQVEAWNGGESAHYVDHADRYDRQLAPFTEALLEQIQLTPHQSLLDVGCGCGALTLAAARFTGSAVGIDISTPLTEVASERASTARIGNVEFVVADAQTHAFAPGTFDLVVSQFGLMFFDEPVGAFSNLRRAVAPGGRLAFVSWQTMPANEWLTVIANQVAKFVEIPAFGGLAKGPGMFALMDPDETTALLKGAGFTEVTFESLHRPSSSAGAVRSTSRWSSFSGWEWPKVWSVWQGRMLMTRWSRPSTRPSPSATSRVWVCSWGQPHGLSPHLPSARFGRPPSPIDRRACRRMDGAI